MKTISFVIPCYASEGSVALVMEEIRQTVAEKPEFDYEIVAVNDCSPDNVLSVLRQEAEADPKVKVVDLAKNGGRHCALMAGFHVTTGDYVVCIDDDLQCPTDQLWNLLAPLEAGDYDMSIARYAKKKQSASKFREQLHNKVSDWLLGKDKSLRFSNFSAMRRFVRDEVIRYRNPYPYISGLMLRATSRVCNVDMEERERTIGTGHYTFKKSFALWMNSFTAFFGETPPSLHGLRVHLRLCRAAGLVYIIVRKLLTPACPLGTAIMAVLLFVGGMILFMLGLEPSAGTSGASISADNSPQFVVRETWNVEEERKEELKL